MKIKTSGFTLIELLVVIAIIGILSSVVLASLGTARSKGKDTSVKAAMNSFRSQAAIIYDSLGSYGVGVNATANTATACSATAANNIFSTTTALAITTQIIANSSTTNPPICMSDVTNVAGQASQAWAMAAQLSDGTQFCVDSVGVAKVKTAANPTAAITTSACN